MSRRFRVSCPHQPARRIEGSVSTPGAGEIGPSKSLARWFRPGVVIATELRQRRPKPSTFRTLTPRYGGSEDQPLYGVARWLGRPRLTSSELPSVLGIAYTSGAGGIGPSASLARRFCPG